MRENRTSGTVWGVSGNRHSYHHTLKEELMEHQPEMIISSELDPGEKLIWSGMPRQGILFRGSDIFMIPFSLMWGGFAIFWEIGVLSIPKDAGPVGIIFPLFGIPFVLIGLYMIFGRFIVDSKTRSNSYYGVTDQRVIIKSGLFRKNVKSLNLRTLTDISLNEKKEGHGSITFGQENPMASWFGGASFPGMGAYNSPKFEMITNAKDVYNKIREAQKKS